MTKITDGCRLPGQPKYYPGLLWWVLSLWWQNEEFFPTSQRTVDKIIQQRGWMERPYHGNDESDKSDLTRLLSCLFCQNNLLPQPPHTQTDTNLKTKLKTEDTTIKLIPQNCCPWTLSILLYYSVPLWTQPLIEYTLIAGSPHTDLTFVKLIVNFQLLEH